MLAVRMENDTHGVSTEHWQTTDFSPMDADVPEDAPVC